jgi:NADH-quinone oxidoreductase subunit E
MLSEEEKKEINEELKHFPHKKAVVIEALKVIQKHRRWVSDESIKELSEYLEMAPEDFDSVATFYNLVYRKPVGRHVIHICDSVSCFILGYEEILRHLKDKLGIELGETTSDGRFTLLPIPCLGTCDKAPALMINEDLHRDLTVDKLDKILESYK